MVLFVFLSLFLGDFAFSDRGSKPNCEPIRRNLKCGTDGGPDFYLNTCREKLQNIGNSTKNLTAMPCRDEIRERAGNDPDAAEKKPQIRKRPDEGVKSQGEGFDQSAEVAKSGDQATKSNIDKAKSGISASEDFSLDRLQSSERYLSDLANEAGGYQNLPAPQQRMYLNDLGLVQQLTAKSSNGERYTEEEASQAKDPVVRERLLAGAAANDAKEEFTREESRLQLQSQNFQQMAATNQERNRSLNSFSNEGQTKTDSVKDEAAISALNLNSQKSSKELSKQKVDSALSSSSGSTDSLEQRLEKSLAKISSNDLRDALRKKLLARLNKNPNEQTLAEAQKEIDGIAAKENLPTGAQSAAEEILAVSKSGGRYPSSLDLEEGARRLQEELQREEDEKSGVTHLDTRSLFERVSNYLKACQEKECVRT